jgi:hypothetical protein
MDKFKVDNFLKVHDEPFPAIAPLSPQECSAARANICSTLQIDANTDGLVVLKEMERVSHAIEKNPCDEGFSLASVLADLGISVGGTVVINWDRFLHMDEINSIDLSKYFTDIWYPSSDDIEILDRSGRWFIMIRHWCSIQVAFFNEETIELR